MGPVFAHELELSGCFTCQGRRHLLEEAAAVTTATAAGICSGYCAAVPLYAEQRRQLARGEWCGGEASGITV